VAEPNHAKQAEFEADVLELAVPASALVQPQVSPENTSEDTRDLTQMQECVQRQINRIRDLEHALDQSLASLDELRLQIVDQNFLEHQLASTEEYANVQEQAIHQLRLQFESQKAELEAQIRQTQDQLGAAEALAQTQQLELERLRTRSIPLPEDAPEQLGKNATETEPKPRGLQKAKPHEWLTPKDWLRHTPKERVVELENQVQELEVQVAKQITTQAMLQQACQELERDREHSQHRIAELEQYAAEMQEQILSQAQQASEYETAVQHWKNRFYDIQDQALALKKWLEEQGSALPEEITEFLASLEEVPTAEPQSTPRRNPFNEDLKIDLPDFLARRRNRKFGS
jgi:peptidoglycan hydrolase CwlO-like protein